MEPTRLEQEICGIDKVIKKIEDDHPGISGRFNLAVSGSASMVMHGIDRGKKIGDIDLFASTAAWLELMASPKWLAYIPSDYDTKRRFDPAFLYQRMAFNITREQGIQGTDTIEVNIFGAWRERDWGNISIRDLFESCREIERIQCVGMKWLQAWKEEVQRPKDLPDIELIDEYLEGSQ